eukprot:11532888-Heterocapsa_arctica.AAC.1
MDRTEWGGYEQIIMWSNIYHIKIEVYCYSMSMQTIDGDDFIIDTRVYHTPLLQQKQMGRHGESLRPDAPHCPSHMQNQELLQKERLTAS